MADDPDETAELLQLPCVEDPAGWDLDRGDLSDWLAAKRTCLTLCPALGECHAYRVEMYPASAAVEANPKENPAGVIWAGVAFSDTGRALTNTQLRLMAAKKRKTAERAAAQDPQRQAACS